MSPTAVPLNESVSATVAHGPRLELIALAAIASHIDTSERPPELSFLCDCLARVAQHASTWQAALNKSLAHPHPSDRPLIQLAQALNLTQLELLTLALTSAVEANVHIGRTLAYIQRPLGGSRPTLSLIATAFPYGHSTATPLHHPNTNQNSSPAPPLPRSPAPSPIAQLINGKALATGLFIRSDTAAPLPEQTLSTPIHIHFALQQQDSALPDTILGIDHIPTIPLPPGTLTKAEQYAHSLSQNPHQVLLLRAASSHECRTVAAHIAQQLKLRPLFITGDLPKGLTPFLLLRLLLPVWCPQLSPNERHRLPAIAHYPGPILAIAGPDGLLSHPTRDLLTWTLPVPTLAERKDLWANILSEQSPNQDDIQALAQNHRYSCDRIAQLSRLAQHHSTLNNRSQPTLEDIRAAAWSGEGIGLDALAQPLIHPIGDDALILPKALRQDLHTLLRRCRSRDTLTAGLGISAAARYTPGVKALFVGASGTGKTLAASWIATQLCTPLYRVDLAAIISKYIGETEKNLAELLAQAERAEVILLFDEADSLFAKRTDVQQANDRFANTQTNYLLQRIESYDGITLLTSNSRQRFDDAFTRRLDLILEFPQPRAAERRALWQSHIGDHHTLTPQQINQLATTVDLCGGHIRNVVLAAAVLAQHHQRPIHFNDIVQGIHTEYRKLARQPPASLQHSL